MKSRILLLALVIAGMASCTQKTCPTYAKKIDVEKTAKTENIQKV